MKVTFNTNVKTGGVIYKEGQVADLSDDLVKKLGTLVSKGEKKAPEKEARVEVPKKEAPVKDIVEQKPKKGGAKK